MYQELFSSPNLQERWRVNNQISAGKREFSNETFFFDEKLVLHNVPEMCNMLFLSRQEHNQLSVLDRIE